MKHPLTNNLVLCIPEEYVASNNFEVMIEPCVRSVSLRLRKILHHFDVKMSGLDSDDEVFFRGRF